MGGGADAGRAVAAELRDIFDHTQREEGAAAGARCGGREWPMGGVKLMNAERCAYEAICLSLSMLFVACNAHSDLAYRRTSLHPAAPRHRLIVTYIRARRCRRRTPLSRCLSLLLRSLYPTCIRTWHAFGPGYLSVSLSLPLLHILWLAPCPGLHAKLTTREQEILSTVRDHLLSRDPPATVSSLAQSRGAREGRTIAEERTSMPLGTGWGRVVAP